jgi:hypothetical protein
VTHPTIPFPSFRLVDGTTGALLIGALTGLLALITIDIARGSNAALAAAGGLGAIVVCIAGSVGSSFWLAGRPGSIHLSPGAGSMCLFAAGAGGLIPALASLSRLTAEATFPVHPLFAVLAGAGGVAAVVALCIPPVRGTSLHKYLLSGPGFAVFWLLVPIGLILFCALAATLSRAAGGMMLILGSAAGLLVWWGGDELVRSEPTVPFVILMHHGNWVAVLIAVTVTIVAAAAALLVPRDRGAGSRPRVFAVTPVIVLAAAAVFVFLLVVHHSNRDGLRLVAHIYTGLPR